MPGQGHINKTPFVCSFSSSHNHCAPNPSYSGTNFSIGEAAHEVFLKLYFSGKLRLICLNQEDQNAC